MDVDELARRELHDAEHLHVLLDRQRDVDLVDPLAGGDLRQLLHGAEKRQAAITDGVGRAGTVVHESNQDKTELRVLEDAIGHHAAELADADDQHALETDATTPPVLQQVADDLARRVREDDGQADEERPHRSRDLEQSNGPIRVAEVIRLDVERAHDAEQCREERADEHAEEVVHPGATASQPIETLQLERRPPPPRP